MDIAVIHYSEIALKGNNKRHFENQLMKNIAEKTKIQPKKLYSRIIISLDKKADFEGIEKSLKSIPGIANFSFAKKAKLDYESIKKEGINILKNLEFETFKVNSKRQNKEFKMNSLELSGKLGYDIINELGKKAKMKNPDIELFIEICDKNAYLYAEKIKGIGGLPIGVSGKVAALLSGGIDSPVAAYSMMKRGCSIVLVHAFNNSINESGVLSKIEKLAKQLSIFQPKIKLYLVPFKDIQKKIIMNVNSKERMIIYRRFMTRIANKIAFKENAKAIITGDSVGQVASQTLENLASIYEASRLPILTPLIGMNKEEIISISKEIGAFEYSIMPYADCCSFMISNHPETKSKIKDILESESKIEEIDYLVLDAIKKAKTMRF